MLSYYSDFKRLLYFRDILQNAVPFWITVFFEIFCKIQRPLWATVFCEIKFASFTHFQLIKSFYSNAIESI